MKKILLFVAVITTLQTLHAQSLLSWSQRSDSNMVFFANATLPTSSNTIPVSGAGRRMMWYTDKAAFRVGIVTGDQWDNGNIGIYSFAAGYNAIAKGEGSFAFGQCEATGGAAFALGYASSATGNYSTALIGGTASGDRSFAVAGNASGLYSISMAGGTSSGNYSLCFGGGNTNGKSSAFAFADRTGQGAVLNDADNQMMMKFIGGYKYFVNNNNQPFSINPSGTVGIDQSNLNNGTVQSGLIFGNQSGEGIASKRTGGGNQFGLDFYSNFINRMSITNSGKVGIGTSTPQQMLSVSGSMNIDQSNVNSGNLNSGLTFGASSGEGIASNRVGGANQYGLDFYGGGINRMCITNGGNVGIGITVPAAKLHVVGNIMASGTITPSDLRYKMNVVPVNNALKKIMSISGYYYSFRASEFPDMNFDTKQQIGVIAQEVEQVLPEVVMTLQNGYKAVDYPKLIPLLIQGMKEQQQQIDELKKLVTELLKNK